jgi:hypothetical protein
LKLKSSRKEGGGEDQPHAQETQRPHHVHSPRCCCLQLLRRRESLSSMEEVRQRHPPGRRRNPDPHRQRTGVRCPPHRACLLPSLARET